MMARVYANLVFRPSKCLVKKRSFSSNTKDSLAIVYNARTGTPSASRLALDASLCPGP